MRREGEVNTLLFLFRLKLGQLSPKVEMEIKNSTKEKITELKINILNIESEKDIKEFIFD